MQVAVQAESLCGFLEHAPFLQERHLLHNRPLHNKDQAQQSENEHKEEQAVHQHLHKIFLNRQAQIRQNEERKPNRETLLEEQVLEGLRQQHKNGEDAEQEARGPLHRQRALPQLAGQLVRRLLFDALAVGAGLDDLALGDGDSALGLLLILPAFALPLIPLEGVIPVSAGGAATRDAKGDDGPPNVRRAGEIVFKDVFLVHLVQVCHLGFVQVSSGRHGASGAGQADRAGAEAGARSKRGAAGAGSEPHAADVDAALVAGLQDAHELLD
mmetsp:Transcript_15118/g.57482  ORF Transcript_15118/g.57482 Transcript_15118/m.57482 type:complete len:270 (+) Transcript_15118:73-882(+)|eukprot:scaffold845_cov231-Pinguiococcus_pyrenoidosus.AAC.18